MGETFEDKNNMYIVMEMCEGGELFDRIVSQGHFSEVDAAISMKQIFRGINYIHKQHVCHRDLKPENFLLLNHEPIRTNELKIIDFGLACMYQKDKPLKSKVGSCFYVSPQVLNGNYDNTADLWSIGCIMFVMLCGHPPFNADTEEQVFKKVTRGVFVFHGEWAGISEDAKDLIKELLEMDPSKRITSAQALKHTWILDAAPNSTGQAVCPPLAKNLLRFQKAGRLKKLALQIMARHVDEKAITQLRDAFINLDVNGEGMLSAEELKTCLADCEQILPDDVQRLAHELDVDGSGHIDYTGFIAATLDLKTYSEEELCWKAFEVLDPNGSGRITAQGLKEALHSDEVDATAVDIAEIVAEVDTNGDGSIDFEGFLGIMRRNSRGDNDLPEGPRVRASRRHTHPTRCCGWFFRNIWLSLMNCRGCFPAPFSQG